MTLRRGILLLALLILLGACITVLSLFQPYAGFNESVFLDIPRGTRTTGVADLLQKTGVIRHRWQFLLTRAFHSNSKLHAGEYVFERPASVWRVFQRIVQGDVFYYELAVPEGQNMYEIAASLGRLGVIKPDDFLRAAKDPSLIRDIAPQAPSLEGYLFPDTYRITRYATAEQLCEQMTQRFRSVWASLEPNADVHSTATLASLVEKETGQASERTLIASVFHNRIRRNMRLECDPTTIYAALLDDRFRGVIHRSDLENQHPYNTYQHTGLPPGPIANAGLESLRAALHPAKTDYLFFVARPDGSGGHTFSERLAAHQEAVRAYRRGNSE